MRTDGKHIEYTVHSCVCSNCGWESGEYMTQKESDLAGQAHAENMHGTERTNFVEDGAA